MSIGLHVRHFLREIERDVRAIVEDMAKDPTASGKIGQQIGDLYASWMDEDAVEKLGTAPLEPYLRRIAAVKDRGGLIVLFTQPGFLTVTGATNGSVAVIETVNLSALPFGRVRYLASRKPAATSLASPFHTRRFETGWPDG